MYYQVPWDTALLFLRKLKIIGIKVSGNTREAVRADLMAMRDKLRDLDIDEEGLLEPTGNDSLSSPNLANSEDPKQEFDDLVMNENTLQAEKVLRRVMLAADGLIDPNTFGRWCEVILVRVKCRPQRSSATIDSNIEGCLCACANVYPR